MTPKKHIQKRIMHEGKLLYRELTSIDSTVPPTIEEDMLYVERVGFKDWHISLHNFYVISDRLCTGGEIVEQKWNYNDFCDITIRMEDCTFLLNRQVEDIVLVRSYKSIPVEEFERIARPLLYKQTAMTCSIKRAITSICNYFRKSKKGIGK